jgi:hypothetical protein
MSDPFSPEHKTVRLEKQNLFGSGYAGSGIGLRELLQFSSALVG